MTKIKTKCLLGRLLSLTMALSLTAVPVYAEGEDENITAAEETVSGAAVTLGSSVSGLLAASNDAAETGETNESESSEGASIGSEEYSSLAEAFAAVGDGETITLCGDMEVNEEAKSDNGLYQISGNVTLDLNGKTLSVTNKRVFGVLSGSLTIINGTVAYSASGDTTLVITRNGASFSAENVIFKAVENSSSTASSLYLVYAAAGGNVKLTNCTVGNASNAAVKDNGNSASVEMSGCDIGSIAAVSGTNYSGYKVYSDITSEDAISADSNNDVKIEGGYIYTVKENGSVSADGTLYVKDCGVLIVDGGSVSGKIVIRDGGRLSVANGTVTGEITVQQGGSLYVSGGSVSGTVINAGYTSVSGGTVQAIKLQTSTSDGTAAAAEEDEPDYTAEISDGVVNGNITVAGGTVLNLSNGTINGTVSTAGTFNMTGGSIEVTALNSDNGAVHVTGGTINISGGSVTASGTKARALSTANGAALTSSVISGGTFTGSNLALLVQTGTTGLSVSGGTFITSASGMASIIDRAGAVAAAYDTASNEIIKDSSNYYKSAVGDYTVIAAEEYYYAAQVETAGGTTIAYSTFAKAAAAANAADGDSTITMLDDIVLDSFVTFSNSSYSITLDLDGKTIGQSDDFSDSYLFCVSGKLTVDDSSDDTSGEISMSNDYGISVTGAGSSLTVGNCAVTNADGYAIQAQDTAAVTINGGTVSGGIYEATGSEVTINSGTVTGDDSYCIRMYGYTGSSGNTAETSLIINGGSVSARYRCIETDNTYCYVRVNGGTVNSKYCGIYLGADNSILHIYGGLVYGEAFGVYADAPSVTAMRDGTVEGGSTQGGSSVKLDDPDAYFNISGGTVKREVEALSAWNLYVIGGTANIYGGTFIGYGYTIYAAGSSSVINMSGGSVVSGWTGIYAGYQSTVNFGGSAVISGVYEGIYQYSESSVTITGGNIYADTYGINIYGGSLDISGEDTVISADGISYSEQDYDGYGIYASSYANDTVNINISGGNITGQTSGIVLASSYDVLTVSGGVITGDVVLTNDGASAKISGGYFSSPVNEAYCAAGYIPTDVLTEGDYEGYYTVTEGTYLGISSDSTAKILANIAEGAGTGTLYVKVSGDYMGTDGYFSTEAYPTTGLTFTGDDGEDCGYIFAGWYSYDETKGYAALTSFPSSTEAYAKFVDANTLTVQCMFTYNVEGYGNIWRLFTSVDSMDYQKVIFELEDVNKEITATYAYSYYEITGTDPHTYFYPSDFSSSSKYVLTNCYMDSEMSMETCSVKASWVTCDGTKVTGSAAVLTQNGETAALRVSASEEG